MFLIYQTHDRLVEARIGKVHVNAFDVNNQFPENATTPSGGGQIMQELEFVVDKRLYGAIINSGDMEPTAVELKLQQFLAVSPGCMSGNRTKGV